MSNMFSRELTVLADGQPVSGFGRACLSGREALGLYPMPFTLRLWNLAEDQFLMLSRAREVSVSCEGSVLACGQVSDVYRRITPEGTVTFAVFSLGLGLWEAPVSLSVEAGVSVSETVRRILAASGTDVPLLSFPGEDMLFSRGQAFFGRASECVASALSAVCARGYLTPSGLCVVPAEGVPVSLELSEKDLVSAPSFPSGSLMVLRTTVTGWPVGKQVSVEYGGLHAEGLILERFVEADTAGVWRTEILIEMASVL